MLSIFLTKSPTVTTRSRSMGKLFSGSMVMGPGGRLRRNVLQASRGLPLIIIPQLPFRCSRSRIGDGASVRAATRRVDPIDEMIRIVGDSVTDPTHQANAPKFPDRRRRPHGRR